MAAHPPPPRYDARSMLPPSSIGVPTSVRAATLRTPSQRRPLVHAILLRLVDEDNSRLFAYAREVLQIFGARGVDVYLQTDVSSKFHPPQLNLLSLPANHFHPSQLSARPITFEVLDEVIASTSIDFIVLIREENMARKTIDVRVRANGQFVESDVEKHALFVLEEWATALARDASPDDLFSLRMNPNVVTNKHVDFFLQQLPTLRGFRSAYASLARLLDCTQKWLAHSNDLDSVDSLKLRATPLPGEGSCSTVSTSSASDENVPSTESEHSNTPSDPQYDESKLSKDEWESLASKALRHGLDALYAARATNPNEMENDVLREASPNMSHIKRSSKPSARLLEGQFRVRSLHNRLVEAFPAIAAAPVAMPSDQVPNDVFSVPSEAHRQRLLREVNFLVVRMEELGSRLSRRPKTRRRRRITNSMNPWSSYIDRFRAMNEKNAATNDSKSSDVVQEVPSYYIHTEPNHAWRCIGCHSLNRRNCSHCRSCGTPSCILERGLLSTDSESTAAAIREAIKYSSQQRGPWMYAPSHVQMSPPPMGSGTGRGNGRVESGHHPLSRSSVQDPLRAPHLPAGSPYQVPASNQLSPELVESLRGLSVEDSGGVGRANGRAARGMMYENPVNSPDSARGLMASIPHFSAPNGSSMSKPRAIPISRPKHEVERSPPSRSPGATDFLYRRRFAEEHRPASFDANMLGNSYGSNQRRKWFCDRETGGEASISAAHSTQSYSQSPPMFGSSLNGFSVPNGSLLESQNRLKRGDIVRATEHPHRLNDQGGRYPSRAQEQFPASLLMNGNGGMLRNPVSHMEELAVGSVEAQPFNPRYTPNKHPSFPPLEHRSSLEDLAAASDAANGGRGSATSESLRAVMAYRMDPSTDRTNRNAGGYGLF